MTEREVLRLKAGAAFWQAIGWALFAVTCQVLRASLLRPPGGP